MPRMTKAERDRAPRAPEQRGRVAGNPVRRFEQLPGLRYTSPGKACQEPRKSCPVQLVFKDGETQLRMCGKAGDRKPGRLVPVSDPVQAAKIARELCRCWKKNRKSFSKCGISNLPLGRADK